MKTLVLFILFVSALISSQRALSASCSTVENGSSLGEERNQDGIGWCYAFAASEVVTHRLGHRVSAVDIASSYVSDAIHRGEPFVRLHQIVRDSSRPVESGDIGDAILATQNGKSGFCSELDIPSGPHLQSRLKSVSQLRDCGESASPKCVQAWQQTKLIFPRLSRAQILASIQDGVSVKAWDTLTKNACSVRSRLPEGTKLVRVTGSNESSRKALLGVVDERLDLGDVVGLQYNPVPFYSSPWWSKPDDAFVDILAGTMKAFGQAELSTHAVAIVGRRYNSSKQICEYEIRDSNSPGCLNTKPDYCDEQHRIWYPRESLVAHSRDIIYLK
jgi:hypothetical protein